MRYIYIYIYLYLYNIFSPKSFHVKRQHIIIQNLGWLNSCNGEIRFPRMKESRSRSMTLKRGLSVET